MINFYDEYDTTAAKMIPAYSGGEADICQGQPVMCVVVPKIGEEAEVELALKDIQSRSGDLYGCVSDRPVYACTIFKDPSSGAWKKPLSTKC